MVEATNPSNPNNEGGRHEMWLDNENKVFHIDLYGFYGVDDAEQFFVDYEKYTTPLNQKDYNIVINCINLSTFKTDILPYLKEAYKAYAEFKSVHFINPTNSIGQMQLKRIAREVNLLEQFQFVNAESELALK
ncbi:hypothetical protein [Paenibacillus sp. NFR01]|uniref:hypothetical protein n=1 Tax=Paenibacillus sp. NFR01 TaxID=1566279 RepID=UPI0008C10D31|nr:hypothetical protein [Paenibacillus sp. NFR01]SES97448.1 hypothetical protein SAMN03159358_0429 [Paenibacillus sp. NFR01]